MPIIVDGDVECVEIPLRQSFATARDRLERQVSRPVVVTLKLDDGQLYQGESVAVAYVTGETPESVQADMLSVLPSLIGREITRLEPLLALLRSSLPTSPSARAGLETALYRAFAERSGLTLWELFGGAQESVESDITLPIVPDVLLRAQEAARKGFRHFKMKIGSGDHEADFRNLLAIHEAVPRAVFRLDANQAFQAEEALVFIQKALEAGVLLELVEQPVLKTDMQSLNAVASRSPVPIFADEAVCSPADALRLVSDTCVQGINVKLMKSGISGALEIIAIARAARRKLMIGCMLETRRGIYPSLALACGTGAFDYIDLDSHLLMGEMDDDAWFRQEGARLIIPEGAVRVPPR
jgi:L-alanine-DL-glutamate epimerase-like enolase superfamily enzyme